MKRILSITIAIVMALTVFAVSPMALKPVQAATTLKAKTTDSVNVRSKAGTNGSVVATFSKGKTFTVKGATKDSKGVYWYKLTYNSKTGYVNSNYATRTGLSTTSITKTTGTVTANDINLRLGPGIGYYSVGEAKKGEKYYANGTAKDSNGNKWYRVYGSDGFKLYISATYFKLAGESSAVTTTSEATTTATATTQTDSNLTMKGKTTSSINVRKGPGTNYSKKGTLKKGKAVTITGLAKASNGYYWYIIKYNSGKGYVSANYVTREGYKVTSITSEKGTVTADSIKLRLGPGTAYPIYTTAKKGTSYTVTGKATDSSGYLWYRIKFDSKLLLYAGSDNISLPSDATANANSSSANESQSGSVTVTTSDITYPTNLAKGSKFTLKGTLTSTQKMTVVETGIANSSGNWISGYKVTSKPNSTTYDINKNVDSAIKFASLSCGTYHYKSVVTTSQGTTTAFDYTFTVQETAAVSISGLSYPTVHNQYKSFTLKGTLSCTQIMTQIEIGIMNSNGSWLSGHYVTVTPNSKSYNLSKVDSKIKFGDLSTGAYIYRCYVTTDTGKQTVFSYSFTVNKNKGIPSALSYGTLSGNKKTDIVKIAMAQVGYNTNKENHTVYNLWYYGSDTAAAWCAIFVSWCADRAGVSTGVIPKMAYVPSITSWYKNKGRFNAKKTLPKKGDLIIYAGSSHIGIVAEDVTSSSGKVSTIEGNTGNDEVKYRKDYMKWNSSSIQGYCSPAY